MNYHSPDDLMAAAARFSVTHVTAVEPFGNGNINDTFLVTLDAGKERRFILQCLNSTVFRRPEIVMQNMLTATQHIQTRLLSIPLDKGRRWETPRVLLTSNGQNHWIDSRGSFWRAMSFIESTETFDTVQSVWHAEEAGFALGMFHKLVSDMPPEQLSDTLEGFHITPRYLAHYNNILRRHLSGRSPETTYCINFIERRRSQATELEDAKACGVLRLRIMHGDPKINNILMDTSTHHSVGMIDLDTVKPGLIHYDIGDCLRSACNPLGEEVAQWAEVRFDTDLCRAILRGYISQARCFLSTRDYEYLFSAVRLIAFELGLRFFTDYLEGNVYFKSRYDGHNLLRALVQFRLTESIESQKEAIWAIIREFR